MRRRVALLLFVLGCGSSSSSTGTDADTCSGPSLLIEGTLTVSPTVHSFPAIAVGAESAPKKFEVLNYECGVAPTVAHRIEGSDEFAITGTTCGPPLRVNATCEVQVVFRPTSPGEKMGRLVVTGDPRGSFIVVLQGTGRGGADGGPLDAGAADAAADAGASFDEATLTATPTELVFAAAVGKSGGPGKLTITNAGRTGSGRITLAIDDSSEFVVGASTCRDPLPPLATCEVTVAFRPASVGTKTAHLTGSANPGKSFSVALSGLGQPPPPVELQPLTQEFEARVPGGSWTAMFTVSKPGVAEVAPIAVSIRGPDAAEFHLAQDYCSGGLYAARSCYINVQFQPSAVGPKSATLVVAAAGLELTAALSGRGVEAAQIAISPSMASFGPGSPRVDFAVKSTGKGGIGKPTIVLEGPDAGDFILAVDDHCNVPLPTGVVCPVTVTFDPRSPGPKSATLRATASPGGTSTAALSGN